MQSRIRVLDSTVIDHIAAGEVVERPASVVKELVENAFDAGAQSVQVDLEGGGLTGITVTDDGSGMTPADARLCVLRHATSKLRRSDDLFCIKTLGFRGEALSSISSVSDFTIVTRPPEASTGFRLSMRGGEHTGEGEVGCPRGTSIQVRELFYNTPARRKFMRAPATEQAHVVDAALRVGLGLRRGGLLVMAGPRRLVDIPEHLTGHERIVAALGPRVKKLAPLECAQDGVRVEGYVSPPEIDRGDTKGLWLFVNGRFIRDRMLQRALLESYPTLSAGRYPTAIIHVDVDPEAVDVNVHPQKLEVRFADATYVFRALTTALRNALPTSTVSVPPVAPKNMGEVVSPAWFAPQATDTRDTARIQPGAAGPQIQSECNTTDAVSSPYGLQPSAAPNDLKLPADSFVPGTILAAASLALARESSSELDRFTDRGVSGGGFHPTQMRASAVSVPPAKVQRTSRPSTVLARLTLWGNVGHYWLAGCDDDVWLLDGQAAARGVAFTELTQQMTQSRIAVHTLLFPERVNVPRALVQPLTDGWESLQLLGFEIEPGGPDTFVLKAVPRALLNADPQELAQTCLSEVWGDSATADVTPQIAQAVLTACAQHVQAPTTLDEAATLLAAMTTAGITQAQAQAHLWLRKLTSADFEG